VRSAVADWVVGRVRLRVARFLANLWQAPLRGQLWHNAGAIVQAVLDDKRMHVRCSAVLWRTAGGLPPLAAPACTQRVPLASGPVRLRSPRGRDLSRPSSRAAPGGACVSARARVRGTEVLPPAAVLAPP
jgi:hypothetical protein